MHARQKFRGDWTRHALGEGPPGPVQGEQCQSQRTPAQTGAQIRVISVIVWSGNELCGEHGVEPLPMGSE